MRELAGTRDDFMGVQLVDLMMKRKISPRSLGVHSRLNLSLQRSLLKTSAGMKNKTAMKYGFDSMTDVTLVGIKKGPHGF